MPFGPYENFDACIADQKGRGHDEESARKICGFIKSKVEHGERLTSSDMRKLAEWTNAFINNLPDSSFAWIEPGGQKDDEGKTTPRALRHLPYKDADGKVDLPHVRNALARVDQVAKMPASEKQALTKKLQGILQEAQSMAECKFSILEISLAENADLSQEFEIITTAKQYDPRYGNFQYSKDDLDKMAKDFNEGVAGIEIAVDINHDPEKRAYAWVQPGSMNVKPARKLQGEYALNARLYRYTPEGEQLVKTGAFRYFSLQIRPRVERFIDGVKKIFTNVIYGLALTNAPVIKDMAPTFSENLFLNFTNMELLKILLADLTGRKFARKEDKALVKKAIETLSEDEKEQVKEDAAKVEAMPEEAPAPAADVSASEKKLAEATQKLTDVEKKLAETETELGKVKTKLTDKELAEKLAEVTLSDTVEIGFAKESLAAVEKFMRSLSEEKLGEFVSLIKAIRRVDLSEHGSEVRELADKEAKAKELACKIATDEKMPMYKAIEEAYKRLGMLDAKK